MTTAQDETVSLPIQIHQSVMSSTNVSMANTSKTNVAVDFISMNTQEHVYGQQQPTEKDARKQRKNLRMDLHVQLRRTRMMPTVKLLLIHTLHIQKTVRNSMSVLMELSHVNWLAVLVRSSMMTSNVVTILKMFLDGKEM